MHFSHQVLANRAHRQVLLDTFGLILWGTPSEAPAYGDISSPTSQPATKENAPKEAFLPKVRAPALASVPAPVAPADAVDQAVAPSIRLVMVRLGALLWLFDQSVWQDAEAFLRDISFFQTGTLASQGTLKPAYFEWPVPLKGAVDQSEFQAIRALTSKMQQWHQADDRFILVGKHAQYWFAKCQLQTEAAFTLPEMDLLMQSVSEKRRLWKFLSVPIAPAPDF